MHFVAETSDRKFLPLLARPRPTYLSIPSLSLSLTTLYHANRRPLLLLLLPLLLSSSDIHLHEEAIVADDRREISSPSSRGTSRPLVTDEGAKTCPVAERGNENGEMGLLRGGGEGGEKTTFTTARSATSITTGWVDSVCRCHEDSVGLGREEEAAAREGEREREANRAEWGYWGVLSGLQSVTMVTPHH